MALFPPLARRPVVALVATLACLASSAFFLPTQARAGLTLQKLTLDSRTGSEDYLFTAGNTVVATGMVDAADKSHPSRSYRLLFKDPSGAVRRATACAFNGAGGSVSDSYAVAAGDPISGSAAWSAVLQQYTDTSCATTEKTSLRSFAVARATTYSDAAMALPASILGARSTAYVKVAGLTNARNDWSTTWVAPDNSTACANTGGGDRPDSDATGALPIGLAASLQYAPGVTGDAWNRQASYDGACPAFTSGRDGAWRLTLRVDSTHFVNMPVFALDATSPGSSGSAPPIVTAPSFSVAYTASDSGAAASGLAKVDLYAKAPGQGGFAKVATDTNSAGSGSISYTAGSGDGSYSFYTAATDKAGNVEVAPASPDATTVLDTAAPRSSASPPAYSTSSTVTVPYTTDDAGSGTAKVELYARAPGESGYSRVATDANPGAAGAFSYTASAGDGAYGFYTVATDKVGRVEQAPSSADGTTVLDTGAPASTAGSPATVAQSSFTVTYSAADAGASASGLAKVDLYAKAPNESGYAKVATDPSPGATGSIPYTAEAGNGNYRFFTVATDRAGNTEATPSDADSTTDVQAPILDVTAPTSTAFAPAYATAQSLDVSYTATDFGAGASGLASVDLYAKAPRDAGYVKVGTDTTPGDGTAIPFTAAGGDGTYSFYTVAVDKAGNTEAPPTSADSATVVDTAAPDSTASPAAWATTSSLTVAYTAADAGSGLAKVELYARAPGGSAYAKVATDATPGATGSFAYTASAGDGAYDFYTLATDTAGNVERAPASPDGTTVLDTAAPASTAASPSSAGVTDLTVSYTAADPGASASGLAQVELYAKRPGAAGYSRVATDTTPGATGSFSYTADAGDGAYAFYTVAKDRAGNVEAAPGTADSTTTVDTAAGGSEVVDELHYTFTGPTSVAFDWRGSATEIRYGKTSAYTATATSRRPDPVPFSSAGPFAEVELTGLEAGTRYHYSVGGGPDHTFTTPPTGAFTFDVQGDIGSSHDFSRVTPHQGQVAADNPDFVLMVGDLTYGNEFGQASVDTHFNDVMGWSTRAAYMPVWGNHEWESPTIDDLRNYKGRFALPHPQTSPTAPAPGCCGEDWSWFDAGGIRFISYPERYTSATWTQWADAARSVFADAQADPSIRYIVTFGHQPAYSTGFHPGSTTLAGILDGFGDAYPKYVLNFNGHSHDYERFIPIHGVTHITTGGGGASLEPPWSSTDPRTAFRAFRLGHARVMVDSDGLRVDAICGPATSKDDVSCTEGSVIDSYTIGDPPPRPPPPATLYVAKQDPRCSDTGSGTEDQPFCTIKPAAARVTAGQTVRVAAGTYNEAVTVASSGTADAPVTFTAVPGDNVVVNGGTNGFNVTSKSDVIIQGFNVRATTSDGIVVKTSTRVTVRGNHVSSAGQQVSGKTGKGIRVDGSTDSTIASNTVDNNTDYGIYLLAGSTRNTITANRIFANAHGFDRAASGIRIHGSSANTISGNVSHDNEDSGIELVTSATDNLVVDNLTYGNGDHGVDVTGSATGARVIGNSVYRNTTSAGINVEGSSFGATVMNNIAVDNGNADSARTPGNIRVDSSSTVGSTIDYDLVFQSGTGRNFEWAGLAYTTLDQLRAASGQEPHGLQADPRWVSPAGADFRLGPASPAIDSANASAPGQTSSDADDNTRVDDPGTPNTGAGIRPYDDRGAYERLPTDLAPEAALSVSPSSGRVDLGVTADASASVDTDGRSPIVSYRFDWGDGSPATGPQGSATATHTFRAAGTYTVTVTVTDTAGLDSTATAKVTVSDDPPVARIAADPTSGRAPVDVTADASGSSDTDGTPIVSYRFDWGDGSPATGPQSGATARHTYESPGDYTLTVTVTDAAGLTSDATVAVSAFGDNDPPTAALSLTPRTGTVDLDVTADASASTDDDGTVESYRFDFGDGSPAVGPQPEATARHTYRAAGSYTVRVTVTDSGGASSSATSTVTVQDLAPDAKVSVSPDSGVAPLDVRADASASTDPDGTPIASYKFDWGDGSAASGPQPGASATHTYAAAGTYTLTARVTDTAGQTSQATAQVVAKRNLVGNPSFETDLTGWNTSASGAGITLTRVTGGHAGNWSAKLTNTGTTSSTCALNDSPDWVKPTQAMRYSDTLWVRSDTPGATLKARWTEYAGSTNVGTTTAQVTLTTAWQPVTLGYTPVSPGSSLDLNVYVSSAAPGTCFYADDFSIVGG